MINIQNLKVIFSAGTPNENIVLKNLGLTVNQGDFITMIGSNGAGKSTLFNAIAGTILPDAGSITMEHLLIQTLSEISPKILNIKERVTSEGFFKTR